jgi:ATP synthase subunit 6
MKFISSPLEQFTVLPWLFKTGLFNYVSLDTVFYTFWIVFFFSSTFICTTIYSKLTKKHNKNGLRLIPTPWQLIIEKIFDVVLSLVSDNIQTTQRTKYVPFVAFIFFFIFSLSGYGLLPFSYTITAQLIVTLGVALACFIAIQIISIRRHGFKFFSLFLPGGISIYLSLLLVPIELISFIFKPISLSIRLFANMMAGHTLLKVIAGFAWLILGFESLAVIAHIFPLLFIAILFLLEAAVVAIQSFVYTVLICIYINEVYNLH